MNIKTERIIESILAMVGAAVILYALYHLTGRDLVGYNDNHS